MTEYPDVIVRVIDFPIGVGRCDGLVMPNDDATYSIYVNARTSYDQQRRAYRHELNHVIRDDFYNERDIKEVEDI